MYGVNIRLDFDLVTIWAIIGLYRSNGNRRHAIIHTRIKQSQNGEIERPRLVSYMRGVVLCANIQIAVEEVRAMHIGKQAGLLDVVIDIDVEFRLFQKHRELGRYSVSKK